MADIFISYSRRDEDFTKQLKEQLKNAGFDIWIDREDILGGSAWQTAISKAIRECNTLIVVLSPDSVASEYVTKEITLADTHNKKIIPIMCRTCELSPAVELQLAGLHYIDFSQLEYESAFGQLARALGQKPEKKPAQKKAPTQQPAQPVAAQPQIQPGFPSAAAQSAFQPQVNLVQVLANTQWQVQIVVPAMGNAMANMMVEFYATGAFQGQIFKMPPTYVSGQWQVPAPNMLTLMGQETNGYQVGPYQTIIQFNSITPNQLIGITQVNEQITMQKSQ
jgi:hypothetical protein